MWLWVWLKSISSVAHRWPQEATIHSNPESDVAAESFTTTSSSSDITMASGTSDVEATVLTASFITSHGISFLLTTWCSWWFDTPSCRTLRKGHSLSRCSSRSSWTSPLNGQSWQTYCQPGKWVTRCSFNASQLNVWYSHMEHQKVLQRIQCESGQARFRSRPWVAW